MKPEDRKRLKQHIEMIVEHKEPDVIAQENFKKLQDEVADLREKNIKLRLELQTLRFKEAQENRFVWWIYQVYAKNVTDFCVAVKTRIPVDYQFGRIDELYKRIKEYTGNIYDGTYLDTAMSTEQSNSDVSMTQDVLTDIKTGQSVENTNHDYYKQEIARLTAELAELKIESEKDYADLRRFQAEFIQADQELAELRERTRWHKYPDELPVGFERIIATDGMFVQSTYFETCNKNALKYWQYLPEPPEEE